MQLDLTAITEHSKTVRYDELKRHIGYSIAYSRLPTLLSTVKKNFPLDTETYQNLMGMALSAHRFDIAISLFKNYGAQPPADNAWISEITESSADKPALTATRAKLHSFTEARHAQGFIYQLVVEAALLGNSGFIKSLLEINPSRVKLEMTPVAFIQKSTVLEDIIKRTNPKNQTPVLKAMDYILSLDIAEPRLVDAVYVAYKQDNLRAFKRLEKHGFVFNQYADSSIKTIMGNDANKILEHILARDVYQISAESLTNIPTYLQANNQIRSIIHAAVLKKQGATLKQAEISSQSAKPPPSIKKPYRI